MLFKTNCIRNPQGVKYTVADDEALKRILTDVLQKAYAVDDSVADIQGFCSKEFMIDDRIRSAL